MRPTPDRYLRGARRSLIGALLAILAPAPLRAGDAPTDPLVLFQQREGALFSVGYHLVTGNAPFCADRTGASGLLLHDVLTYSDPERARAIWRLRGDIGAAAIAPASAAAQAGLSVDDTVIAVNGLAVGPPPSPAVPPWTRLARLEAALSRSPVAVQWRDTAGREREAELAPAPACRARFALGQSANGAMADGDTVLFDQDLPLSEWPEDDLAAAVAHELAHVVLRHAAAMPHAPVRSLEREADRLTPWLLANAGYDPAAAPRFIAEWGRRRGRGDGPRQHDGWRRRQASMRAELPRIAAALRATGRADWSAVFIPRTASGQAPEE